MSASDVIAGHATVRERARAAGVHVGRWSDHAIPAYTVLAIAAVVLPELEATRVSGAAHLPFVAALTAAAVVTGYATWRRIGEQATSEAALVFFAFALLAGVYSPHLLLTDTAVDPQHLVFGPVSRASFSLVLLAAVGGVRVPRVMRSRWGAVVVAAAAVVTIDTALHSAAFESLLLRDPIRLIRTFEWVSLGADAVVLGLIGLRARAQDGRFIATLGRAMAAMVISSGLFLLSAPWQTRWWIAHLGLAVVAAVVIGHIVRERALAGSLAGVVDVDAVTSVADLLVDEVDSGVVLIDGHGDVVGWNRAAEALTGWDRTYAQRYFPRGPLTGVVGVGPATVRVRQTTLNRLGRAIHVTFFSDVSREVRLGVEKARLDDLTTSLERANAAKNQLLGVVAHELRNPLGAVRGFAQVLRSRLEDQLDDVGALLLQRVEASSERMLEMVDDLLSLSSLEEQALSLRIRRERVDLTELVASVVEVNAPAAHEKQIELLLDVGAEDCTASVDGAKIEQVVTNLVTNAVKFSHGGSQVVVRIDASGAHVRLSVRDEGPGIPADEIADLFEPFSRTSVAPTGGERSTGLGLTIVKRIVDAHAGTIGVESEVGKGSTFTVLLPRLVDGAGAPADDQPVTDEVPELTSHETVPAAS